MPLYTIQCLTCGREDNIFRKLSEYDNLPYCKCNDAVMVRKVTAPLVISEFQSYISPATGREITSRAAREDDLKRSGTFLHESGVEKDIARNKLAADEKAFAPVSSAIDNIVRNLVNERKLEA